MELDVEWNKLIQFLVDIENAESLKSIKGKLNSFGLGDFVSIETKIVKLDKIHREMKDLANSYGPSKSIQEDYREAREYKPTVENFYNLIEEPGDLESNIDLLDEWIEESQGTLDEMKKTVKATEKAGPKITEISEYIDENRRNYVRNKQYWREIWRPNLFRQRGRV